MHAEDGPGPDECVSQLRRRVWTRRLVLRQPKVVVPSRKLAAMACETWGVDDRRLVYVPNGVDLAHFPAREDRPTRWPTGGPVIGTYAGFDLFALSSDTEQMPFSVLEAMASGLPIAGTDVGDVKAMVSSENQSFIVPPSDLALAEALRTLVLDSSLARRIGAANRAKAVREFDQEHMFAAYAKLWRGP